MEKAWPKGGGLCKRIDKFYEEVEELGSRVWEVKELEKALVADLQRVRLFEDVGSVDAAGTKHPTFALTFVVNSSIRQFVSSSIRPFVF